MFKIFGLYVKLTPGVLVCGLCQTNHLFPLTYGGKKFVVAEYYLFENGGKFGFKTTHLLPKFF